MSEPALTPEQLEELRALAASGRSTRALDERIKPGLLQLGLIEETLDGYVVTSRGHAHILKDL